MTVSLNILDQTLSTNFPELTDEYRKFATKKDKCKACSLRNDYNQVTQAEGCVDRPTFLFVGEAPGADEVQANRPFIGKAGQRLRDEMKRYPEVFNKKTTLISNVVACRPLNNIFPSDEIARGCCERWLLKEIELVQPRIIVTLGNQPLKYLRNETGITSKRGTWKWLNHLQVWSFATYHPSYVIRCQYMPASNVAAQFQLDLANLAISWEEKISK